MLNFRFFAIYNFLKRQKYNFTQHFPELFFRFMELKSFSCVLKKKISKRIRIRIRFVSLDSNWKQCRSATLPVPVIFFKKLILLGFETVGQREWYVEAIAAWCCIYSIKYLIFVLLIYLWIIFLFKHCFFMNVYNNVHITMGGQCQTNPWPAVSD